MLVAIEPGNENDGYGPDKEMAQRRVGKQPARAKGASKSQRKGGDDPYLRKAERKKPAMKRKTSAGGPLRKEKTLQLGRNRRRKT